MSNVLWIIITGLAAWVVGCLFGRALARADAARAKREALRRGEIDAGDARG